MLDAPPASDEPRVGGGCAAAAAADGAADRERFALIRDAALIADAKLTTGEVIERLTALLTPTFADTCDDRARTSRATPIHREHELVVPLRSRGRDIGTMRLTHAHRTYSAADYEFAQLIGGRAALALENAQLAQRETHLTTALDSLAEAVTIQDAGVGPDLRQRRGRRGARVRERRAAAGHAARGHHRRLRVLPRRRPPAHARGSARPRGAAGRARRSR